ncbi:hypothetical protein [Chryseobacterium culicis]|uniref:hypothetical protein n=1 Tax=Chryseobacterium culicis TaxID=680127 RepID=UPI000B7E829A|nr:hypothetical protein [Chryseobacterium culicis]
MTHNSNFNDRTGKYSLFSVKEIAWHNLGKTVEEHPTSGEVIKFAELAYQAEKSPLFTKAIGLIESQDELIMSDSELQVPNYLANIRTPLGWLYLTRVIDLFDRKVIG